MKRQSIFGLTNVETGELEQLSGDDVYFSISDAQKEVERRKRDYQEDYAITEFSSAPAVSLAELVPGVAVKLLNILDRHTVGLGWGEKPVTLSELVVARDGREEMDSCRDAILRKDEEAK